MQRISAAILAAGLSLGFGSAAFAADMPAKAPVYKAPPPVVYNWTGFYIGANAGYSWGDPSIDYSQAAPGAIGFPPGLSPFLLIPAFRRGCG